jgi:UDP-N-acetylglucosamine/UDP-N-acetyl-alpha-D-glucosaminouronate 4-epimerase
VNQLWKEICGITGATVSPTFGEPRPGDVRDSLASLERSTSLLGYTPKTSLIEGLQETVGWYENVLAAGVE